MYRPVRRLLGPSKKMGLEHQPHIGLIDLVGAIPLSSGSIP
ncbi:hypothetical protein D1BOALGB6SA_3107 [Olavius sp. associated proteobacterium Delta 1]|nr:hypothetical protein D1BOALGB6SA_3107 [Olavius sp. associated proteobacterium Delta 1]